MERRYLWIVGSNPALPTNTRPASLRSFKVKAYPRFVVGGAY